MNELDLRGATRLARAALAGGPPVALAVVVEAPEERWVGRRLAWAGNRLHGALPGRVMAEIEALLREALEPDRRAEPGCHVVGGGKWTVYVERVLPPPELVVVGAGHLARPLTSVGRLLGFRVTVLDDRPEFARLDRFPDADRVLAVDFGDPFAEVALGPETRLVLVTRGHRYDYDCLRDLAGRGVQPAYVGMIGSRRRVRAAFEQLVAQGVDPAWLGRVHAPIGLDVGAETPAEIAVAIGAEMILAAHGGEAIPLARKANVLRYVKSVASGAASEGGGSP